MSREIDFDILWTKEQRIALALSGGVDSIVLFHLLVTKYKNSYKELVVFHINHGLRKESEEEEIFVENLAKKYNIKFLKRSLNMASLIRDSHTSEEMQARELRYSAFETMAHEENINILLTAHHKNDRVENIIMRLLSGRGIDYNLTIDEEIKLNNLEIKRPLLNSEKIILEKYAENNKLRYYEDASNFNTDYTRNYIRHKIIPLITDVNEAALENLINFAQYYKNINTKLKEKTLDNFEKMVISKTSNKIILAADLLLRLSTEEIYFILKRAIDELEVQNIKQKAIFAVISDLKENFCNKSYDLKNNLKIVSEYGNIYVHKIEKKCYNDKIELKIEKVTLEKYTFYDTEFIISEHSQGADIGFNTEDLPLTINTRKNGDTIRRGNITKKLSRIFIDEKVPKEQRDKLAVVRNKNQEVLAVLGLTTSNKNKKYDYYIKMKGHQPWRI